MQDITKRRDKKIGKRRIDVPLFLLNWNSKNKYDSNPLIEVEMYGETYKFLIDTGSSISFIDKPVIQKDMHLSSLIRKVASRGHIINMMGGNEKADKIINITDFSIGGGKAIEHTFHILDMKIDYKNKGLIYHGIIGFDLLLLLGFSFNFKDFTAHYHQ